MCSCNIRDVKNIRCKEVQRIKGLDCHCCNCLRPEASGNMYVNRNTRLICKSCINKTPKRRLTPPLSPQPIKKEKLLEIPDLVEDPLQELILNPCTRYNQKAENELCDQCKYDTTCQRCNRTVYENKGKESIKWFSNYQYDKICDRCDSEMQLKCINCKRSQKLRGSIATHLIINDITKLCEKCESLEERYERTGSYNKIKNCYVSKKDTDQYDSNNRAIVCLKMCHNIRSIETAIYKVK